MVTTEEQRRVAYCHCGAKLAGDSAEGLFEAAERHIAEHHQPHGGSGAATGSGPLGAGDAAAGSGPLGADDVARAGDHPMGWGH